MKLKFALLVRVFANLTGGEIEHEPGEGIDRLGRITGHRVLGRPPITTMTTAEPGFFAVNIKEVV